jgi:GTP-binding protein
LDADILTAEPAATAAAAEAADHSPDDTTYSSSSTDSMEEVPEFPEMQLVLPDPTHSQIKTAEFVKSSVDVAGCPQPKYPEFAVIGRSNVGKSSLINLLTNRKSLAMVSKQPGKW